MKDWKAALEEAKALLDKGLISPAQFESIQEQALQQLGQPQESQMADQPIQIGSYRILNRIGYGGMGEVFRGRHSNETIALRQGGDVAVKKMHARFLNNPEYRERFDREASLGLKLNHEGIVKVYDLIQDGNELGLVMELVNGMPLSEKIGSEVGPIPWEQAKPLFLKILAAVSHAHEKGIIHRDIKPENILVTANGVKILDFGIAKDISANHTKTGVGMGTVDYMAPEQYTDARSVDRRSDIYALGMTLYEMVAGRLPWEAGSTDFGILKLKDAGTLPPPTHYYPHIPHSVVAQIFKATARDPNQRHQTVSDLIDALNNGITGNDAGESTWTQAPTHMQDITPSPINPETKGSKKGPSVGLVMAGLGLAVVGVGLSIWESEEPKSEKKSVAAEQKKEEPALLKSDLGFNHIRIPAGSFVMGSPRSEKGHMRNEKQHKVHIRRSFRIMETEVTQGLWSKVMGNNPAKKKQCGLNCPVERVSWHSAIKFANQLSEKEGLTPCYEIKSTSPFGYVDAQVTQVEWSDGLDCKGWRLPTEAEWEYAARGGQDFAYSGSATAGEVGWYGKELAGNSTNPVCTKQKNAYGLCDMSGNVWEWIWDPYSEFYPDEITDPVGPTYSDFRTWRGGGWRSKDTITRVARRGWESPTKKYKTLGFRLVRTVGKANTTGPAPQTPSGLGSTRQDFYGDWALINPKDPVNNEFELHISAREIYFYNGGPFQVFYRPVLQDNELLLYTVNVAGSNSFNEIYKDYKPSKKVAARIRLKGRNKLTANVESDEWMPNKRATLKRKR